MNPFLFKSHPLLHATIGLLTGAEAFSFRQIITLAATYLALNVPLAVLLARRVVKAVHVRLRFRAAYLLALPATVLYLPIGLTLLSDVVHHTFLLDHRFLFLFALLVATVLIAALFGIALHYRNGDPVGSETGLILALTIFLACIPYGLVLLGLDRLFQIFPAT
ncbi:MAG: hypothetical protein MUF20_06040 [Methylotetracoccus sp.]|jgi:hypothetical protein|nr:hypothetical protein [Methylotetracoccus sp.]